MPHVDSTAVVAPRRNKAAGCQGGDTTSQHMRTSLPPSHRHRLRESQALLDPGFENGPCPPSQSVRLDASDSGLKFASPPRARRRLLGVLKEPPGTRGNHRLEGRSICSMTVRLHVIRCQASALGGRYNGLETGAFNAGRAITSSGIMYFHTPSAFERTVGFGPPSFQLRQ